MYNNNNLTAQQHQQAPQPDIYAILSTDDPTTIDSSGSIDTDALVMDIFDINYSTITATTINATASPAAIPPPPPPPPYDDHPLSNNSTSNNSIESSNTNNNNNTSFPTPNSTFSSTTTSNEFNFNQDLINFDITTATSQPQQQYTPTSEVNMDPFFQFYPYEDPIFPSFNPPPSASTNIDFTSRRHSVAVSGGIADFNLRNLSQNYQPTSTSRGSSPFENNNTTTQQVQQQPQVQRQRHQLQVQQPPSFSRRSLTTVVEAESQPNMIHRASMPNIFLTEESRRQLTNNIQQRVSSLSARTTPNSTPPPVSINFNQMPWSTNTNNNQQQEWNPHKELLSDSFISNNDQQPMIGRKRFYSQQFDSLPSNPTRPYAGNITPPPYRQLQQPTASNLCPLPMSGVMSRRTSVVTPNDICTWNRMVNPNDRIVLEEQRKRRAQSIGGSILEENAAPAAAMNNFINTHQNKKRLREPEDDVDSITSEDTNAEDYPVITEADLEAAKKDPNAIPRRQKLRYEGDEYTPKWVRYTGQLKEGYCDTCKLGKWLQLKNSAYWYHKQFYHGISSVSGKPFQRPLEQRAGEHDVIEGLCHQCKQFVPICNSKRKNSVLWYRHAHKCHIYDKPKSKGGKRASISVTPTSTPGSNSNSNRKFQLNDQLQKIY